MENVVRFVANYLSISSSPALPTELSGLWRSQVVTKRTNRLVTKHKAHE